MTQANQRPVQVGVGLPSLDDSDRPDSPGIPSAARQVEALGLDFVMAADLIVGDGTPALDASIVLAVAATVTERVRIGFGVLSLPLRPVAWVATQVQTLQHLSGGRVLLGVGTGGMPDTPFWPAVGVPGQERGRRTDEALRALPRLIAGEPTRLADQPSPTPLTLRPAAAIPPILVGGNSAAALRRAASYGDGWYPSQITPPTLASGVTVLRDLAADLGRDVPAVYVGGLTLQTDRAAADAARNARAAFVSGLPGEHGISADAATSTVVESPAEAADRISAYADAGATAVSISPGVGQFEADWMRHCEQIAEARAILA